jgi:hypothetical protein
MGSKKAGISSDFLEKLHDFKKISIGNLAAF